ncbi:MAG: nicotinate (nicotinamide) nucleotide adenylyltransferase [Candidatus Pacearchaeota archaeon]|jgi:nicotinate-nucleotide adenylyltransferase|nr:nicotinate (nicotinamide) nucleotide adenylyltransferase [Clostridia bacterium]
MKTVGILGGSFDPITRGHIFIANHVLKETHVDEIWVIPCNTHKQGKNLTAYENRIEMIQAALNDEDPRIIVNDIELRMQLSGYTRDLFAALKSEYPDIDFYFIMGQDVANNFDTFYQSAYLKEHAKFIVISRTGIQPVIDKQWYVKSPNIYLGKANVIEETSSTKARDFFKLKKYQDVLSQVPLPVLSYMLDKELYK